MRENGGLALTFDTMREAEGMGNTLLEKRKKERKKACVAVGRAHAVDVVLPFQAKSIDWRQGPRGGTRGGFYLVSLTRIGNWSRAE